MDNKNFSLREDDKIDLISQLEYAKEIRKQIAKDTYKPISYKGDIRFEHILINNSLKLFHNELIKSYSKKNNFDKKGRKFSQKFKAELCPFLTDIVIKWFSKDERSDFSFETALLPFYKKTEEYKLKLMKKKFQYSPYKFFY